MLAMAVGMMALPGQHTTLASLLLGLLLCIYPTSPHPQCLDFKPPFKSRERINFCSSTRDFGCCTAKQDGWIRAEYEGVLSQMRRSDMTPSKKRTCSEFVKSILCQECSPYAAHLYDAEATLYKKPFPGLCGNYCTDFYTNCSEVLSYFVYDDELLQAAASKDTFCAHIALTDKDYCYPELLSNPVLNEGIVNNTKAGDGCLCVEEFTAGLANPLLLESPPDGTGRLFIAEQIGHVFIFYKNGTRLPEPFLNFTDVVLTSTWRGDERGFLGLTFHPDFKENQRLFVYYSTRRDTDQFVRISEFTTNEHNRNLIDRSSEKVLFQISQPFWNHNGGELLFGHDGYLYIFVGDGGGAGDPMGVSQNKEKLLGKVLRVDVDNQDENSTYTIPPDNPFNDSDARPEVYAYGIRNIWRCDVDEGHPRTGAGAGRIICGDVGQDAMEEIDLIVKGGNYGWNAREGYNCYNEDICGEIGEEVLPIYAYSHAYGKSVTGGHVYRGCLNPALQGQYIYGDFTSGRLFKLVPEPSGSGEWHNKEIFMCGADYCTGTMASEYSRSILSFGEDDDGEIYMLSTSYASTTSSTGRIYKLIDPRRRGDPTTCRTEVARRKAEEARRKAEEEAKRKKENEWETVTGGVASWRLEVTTCVMIPLITCITYYI